MHSNSAPISHFPILLPCCSVFSNTLDRTPKGSNVSNLDGLLEYAKSGRRISPSFGLGIELMISFANLVAYDHN